MATAVIQINTATGSRSDLTLGVQVNLNDAGTGAIVRLWEFLSRPPGSSATLNNPTSKTPDFTPDVVGSYRIRLTVNSSVVDIAIGAVRTTNLSLRVPATGEEDEFDESGNTDGWSSSMHEALLAIDTDSVSAKTPTAHAESHQDGYSDELTVQDLGSGAAASNQILVSDGSGGWSVSAKPSLDETYNEGRYIFVDSGPVILAASDGNALQMDGYLTLVQILEPGFVPVSGILYTKNIDGYVDLFFKDNYGYGVQITGDGYLDTFGGVRGVGLFEQSGDPTPESQKGFIYSGDESGRTELFYMDNYGSVVQITSDGYLDVFESVPGVGLFEQGSDPSAAPQKGFIYSKDDSGTTELFYMDNYGVITQITNDGYLDTFESVPGVGMFEQASDPAAAPDKAFIYSKQSGGGITELFFMDSNGSVTQMTNDGYVSGTAASGFTDLSDTPASYSGEAGKYVVVNDTEDGIEFGIIDGGTGLVDGYLPMPEKASDPPYEDGYGSIYTKDVSGITEMFFIDNLGTVTQVTSDGYIGAEVQGDGYDELAPSDTNGTETSLSLSEWPVVEPDMPSGYALDMFINGQKMRYVETLDAYETEFTYDPSLNKVEFLASGTAGTWYCARYRTTTGIHPPPADVATIFTSVVLDQDRTSSIVNKSGRNTVAFDIELTAADGYSFGTEGTLKVIAGNTASIDGYDTLDVPQWTVEVDGYVKLELETGFTHVGLFFDHTSDDGYGDTISASVAVS